jgi:O-antigen ligase
MSSSRSVVNFRLLLICFVAVCVSLPMAWVSVSKVLLFLSGLAYLAHGYFTKRADTDFHSLWTPKLVLLILLAFSASLLWTEADMAIAGMALSKHSKLISLVFLVLIIRTAREARIGLLAFATGQIFLLLSSWLLAVGVPIPWTTNPTGKYVVFSTYLDQSIIFATMAGVFWHLRADTLWPRWMAVLVALAALVNVLLLLEGRTGYAVALTVLTLATMWLMPKRLRLAALLVTPFIVLLALFVGSAQVKERVSKIVEESQNYATQVNSDSSSGWRLNAWHRSLQAIQTSPGLGHGVGSWAVTVKQLQGSNATQVFGPGQASNPHQEYLLWGVELGVGGIVLLLALLLSVIRDSRSFTPSVQRAVLSTLAAMAVACLFNSTLYDDLMGDYFCVVLGLLLALGLKTRLDSPTATNTLSEPATSKAIP